MTEIIIYCTFCYLAELGILLKAKNKAWGSLFLAPIMFPLELGAILGANFM